MVEKLKRIANHMHLSLTIKFMHHGTIDVRHDHSGTLGPQLYI